MNVGPVHIPILLQPIVDGLIQPLRKLAVNAPAALIIDCTFGGGGHTGALLDALVADPTLNRHSVLALDRDPGAVERGRVRYARALAEGRLFLEHAPFSQAPEIVTRMRAAAGISASTHTSAPAGQTLPVLGVLADLGFSSDQMDDPERGLSIRQNGPLDMRLDTSQGESCRELLARIPERELADIIFNFGEERFSRRIAAQIIWARQEKRLPQTTQELAELVVRAIPGAARQGDRSGRIHAATRTFQALRIAVNGELEELDSLLKHAMILIAPPGRMAVMSFHSLEDREVKRFFRSKENGFNPLTKKPLEADDAEVAQNSRSRSAKLRIAERI